MNERIDARYERDLLQAVQEVEKQRSPCCAVSHVSVQQGERDGTKTWILPPNSFLNGWKAMAIAGRQHRKSDRNGEKTPTTFRKNVVQLFGGLSGGKIQYLQGFVRDILNGG